MMLRVLFIGAGAVNFGGPGLPWDHSRRLEALGNVVVVAIADLDLARAASVLERKLLGAYASMYSDCKLYASYVDALEATSPDVAFIGVPPFCHGDAYPPRNVEIRCLEKGLHLFVEKPISVQPPEELSTYAAAIKLLQEEKALVVSVGYMFRYHPAVEKARRLLSDQGKRPLCITASYHCDYSELDHPFWWDKSRSGGPIVEQATHLFDLMRLFGGEAKRHTVRAVSVPASDQPGAAGHLGKVPPVVKEAELPTERRISRVTTGHWLFEDGAAGTLTHAVCVHGTKCETRLDILADGMRITLHDLHFPESRLCLRLGESEVESIYSFPDADPYLEEIRTFLAAVRNRDIKGVRSTYDDALRTYQLSWDVRRAGETSEQFS